MNDSPSQPSWRPVIVVLVMGFVFAAVGVRLSTAVGFPGLGRWPLEVERLLLRPFLIGGGIGLLLIALSTLTPRQYRIPQLPFPDSLLPYIIGGTYEEILFRMFLLPLVLWLLFFIPSAQELYADELFWGTAVTLSALYTLLQLTGIQGLFKIPTLGQIPATLIVSLVLASGFGSVVGAYYFREGGFVASYALRVGVYLVWHIVWGAYAVPHGLVPHRREVEEQEGQ
ncbi:MAG: hypothetical protein IPL28_23940 [Chloroflexi bacterium]|nr:hypothetical protein [Chloroflexota bacterium]